LRPNHFDKTASSTTTDAGAACQAEKVIVAA
jgi:hypothetical protein